MTKFGVLGLSALAAIANVASPASAEEGWESAANGICLFKARSDTSKDLTKELNFQIKSPLVSGQILSEANFRIDDRNGLMNGVAMKQVGYNGEVMALSSRSEADVEGGPVIALMITISDPPQSRNFAAIVSGTIGNAESMAAIYHGMCSVHTLEKGADGAWQATMKETSKSQ